MRAQPLRDKYRASQEPRPLYDYPKWHVPAAVAILLVVMAFLLFFQGCGLSKLLWRFD